MEEFKLIESTASEWHRAARFGVQWSRESAVPGWGGLGTQGRVVLGELVPNGPPKRYHVTITPTYEGIDWAFPGTVNEGIIRARIYSSVGQARHELICDAFGGGIVVSGGIIQVNFEQTAATRLLIKTLDVSIAVTGETLNATYTIPCPLTEPAEAGYPAEYLSYDSSQAQGISLPTTARKFILSSVPSDGTYTVEFYNSFGDLLATFNTGTDRDLRGDGVRLPVGTDWFLVTGKPTAVGPIATLVLG